jgi:hypothetical protein
VFRSLRLSLLWLLAMFVVALMSTWSRAASRHPGSIVMTPDVEWRPRLPRLLEDRPEVKDVAQAAQGVRGRFEY